MFQVKLPSVKNMKAIVILLSLIAVSEACTSCNGVTPAVCASPCFNCGACNSRCCQYWFSFPFGREEVNDRTYGGFGGGFNNGRIIPCLSGNGREEEENNGIDPVLDTVERQAFILCDKDGDQGLTWIEVSNCIETLGSLIKGVNLPTEEEFNRFDTNQDGVLFYEEWAAVESKN